jgi:zinc protease
MMKLEADRMANLKLDAKEFAAEIKVVMEERRLRTDDQPHSLVYEKLRSTAFQVHPYRNPIIGWMTDLESMTVQDTRDWYERWYAPNNAVLVVVGDVDPKEVFALAEKHFGKIRPRTLPARKPQVEPPQAGIQRVTVKAPGELPYVSLAFHAPVLRDVENDWEPYALEVLAGVLDGNASARLNRSLVREARIAQSVDAGYDATARGPGLFYLSGIPVEGRSAADVEAALRAEVAKIVKEGVTEEELNRVKAQVTAGQVFQRDSVFYQAMLIGQFEMVGLSYKDIDRVVAKIREVTAAQVQEVARKYLVDDRLTVAVLDPQPLDAKAPRAPVKGMRHAN